MKLAKAISRRIRDLREAAGLSQQDVAMRADLSMSLVAKLEQGKKADPRASTLLALAKALAVPPGKLLDDLGLSQPEAGTAEPESLSKDGKKKKKKSKAADLAMSEAIPAPEVNAPTTPPADAPTLPSAGEPSAAENGRKKKKKNKAKHKQS